MIYPGVTLLTTAVLQQVLQIQLWCLRNLTCLCMQPNMQESLML